MPRRVIIRGAVLVFAKSLCVPALLAQSVCDSGNGPLDQAQPSTRTPTEIIEKFAAQEAVFKAAKENYGYIVDVTIQTLGPNGGVSGEYRQTSQITLDGSGKRIERTTFAPENSLRALTLTPDDLADIRTRLAFAFTPDELPQFNITYAGRQHVDQINTYVFNVSAKNPKKGASLFDGRIWVDDQDLMIVKTCGKPHRGDTETPKRGPVERVPTFVTYREEVDGKYWFTTYAHADEYLDFRRYSAHVRETIKYSAFAPLSSATVTPSP
jgi:hypothetical protein